MASSAMTKTNITTDQLALFTLKSQIISDPFHFLDESWSFATSVCHWVEVTCGSHHQRVKSLNLNFNSIEAQIPKVIGNLRELKLRGNNLIGSIPLSLSNASRLETLDISYNSLQGNIPEEISNLHNMKVLSIQDNQLTGSIPFIIFNISRIEVIAFSGNSLSGYLPYGLCNGLPTLKGLYLWKKKLCGHMPTSFSNCSLLQILALPDNEFGGPMHSEFGRLINLQILELGMNRFTGAFHLMNTSTIVSYNFRILIFCTLISGIIPQEIENLVNLVELAMEKNHITGSVPISTFNISLLQILSVWENNLSGFLPREISSLIELEQLRLAFNSFGGSLPMEIFNISGLRVIDLTNNNLSGSLPPNRGIDKPYFLL
ncbi:hypothetical protein T459_11283 [Capsicum annuum]|uniref:Leucine-rich repeat-containing N-terminal plant-type domain-containing protein n=1 Tax=Capsicum annuum TaxID=4072 RepID=A0A2G2ZLG2_CAPAN|nr:hypothetical protein T459_11283 [Capsicum annuum]